LKSGDERFSTGTLQRGKKGDDECACTRRRKEEKVYVYDMKIDK